MNTETPDPTQQPSATTVEVFGEHIDINDDVRLLEVMRAQAKHLISGMPPPASKAVLLYLIAEIRLCTVKFGYILNRANQTGHAGIGLDTCASVYSQMLSLCEMQTPGTEADQDPEPANDPEVAGVPDAPHSTDEL